MKVAIRYFSRGGHVRAMAEALAKGCGIDAVSIDDPDAEITEPIDLLFIGSALYNFQLDARFKEYLNNLPSELIGEAICFGSSWLTRRPIYLMQEYLKAKDIKINKQAIYSRNMPNDDLLGVIEYFAQNEMTRDRSLDGLPPYMVFKRSQEIKERREAERAAAEAEGREYDPDAEYKERKAQRAAEQAREEAEAAQLAAQQAQEAAAKAAEEAAEAARIAAEKAQAAADALAAAEAESEVEAETEAAEE